MSLPDIPLTRPGGTTYSFKDLTGKTIIVVNTASQCGLRGQFKELESLYQTYQDQGLVVLGFPSDQFKQENLSNEEIAEACQINFGVSFPLHKLCKVNGSDTHLLFAWLKDQDGGLLGKSIKWNFTKFLVTKDGAKVTRFAPKTSPRAMVEAIEADLAK
ncbi:glutathione peroxidase [Eremococcus coleocola]|uniref:Glutathione peroxidase n=1 Tax=Eremococcus coleocola ACS-139-V-Col8 TaxID=908337 RepID=E4KND5_9LACT|nr:glutathione peroxidase [Eremococcus coleocola]EFR31549.1 glutathione peroxidase [Eremococcus coleocola ACS-139-V-Col8]